MYYRFHRFLQGWWRSIFLYSGCLHYMYEWTSLGTILMHWLTPELTRCDNGAIWAVDCGIFPCRTGSWGCVTTHQVWLCSSTSVDKEGDFRGVDVSHSITALSFAISIAQFFAHHPCSCVVKVVVAHWHPLFVFVDLDPSITYITTSRETNCRDTSCTIHKDVLDLRIP